jgi:hypothetical protein
MSSKLSAYLLLTALWVLGSPAHARDTRLLDAFEDASPWQVVASNQVSGRLRMAAGSTDKALCLDYDFNGVSGYVGMQRELPLAYPADYEFSFDLRGDSPANDLQFKVVDGSGDNVWWVNKPRYAFPTQWTHVVYKKRHISRAWGPDPDSVLHRSRKLEFTIYNSVGGKGSVCFDSLALRERTVDASPPPRPKAWATAEIGNDVVSNAVDGRADTLWRAAAKGRITYRLDLGRVREFGGLRLRWAPGEAASAYDIAISDDGIQWTDVRSVVEGNGGMDPIALPESEARYVRLRLKQGQGAHYGLQEIEIEPLSFGATPNDFIQSLAKDAPRGLFPRGFQGEQSYWTIVGVDGGTNQGLIGEDGAIETGRGGVSITPFVLVDSKLATWSDVRLSQSLQDGYLPIPSVDWTHPDFSLRVTAFARGDRNQVQMLVRYVLANTGEAAREYVLALAVQPWQVNPPSQFLSTPGGFSPIRFLSMNGNVMVDPNALLDGHTQDSRVVLWNLQRPDATFATSFDAGLIAEHLRSGDVFGNADPMQRSAVADETGMASGAMLYRMRLQPGEHKEVSLYVPLAELGTVQGAPHPLQNANNQPPAGPSFDVETAQREVAEQWRAKLDATKIRVPRQGRPLVNTLRTALAHMLISRTGPRLQPGTRSYARAWIRDGAMIAEGLLRMGREDVAEEFVRWYAPYQFDNGKVPCCVDDRGSDPVPENDSHGELIYAVAELYRYTRDKSLLEAMWPHVEGAVKYMDELRLSERTPANRARDPAFYGMMPASISHEGYSAKPMHSYWDNFWALRGYKDAVDVAQWLGKRDEAVAFAASRDQFRDDLHASLQAATRQRGIDFLPGSAELGDFDATSTTIALAPGGEQQRLPAELLHNTFERYWREFVARRDGAREWKDYTPYELRTIGSFVRLGWRDRAHEALDYFFKDQQPRGWNQWAEVVSRTPRKPFFVGDLPHAWVESDYVRSVLDMFAYVREDDDALVIAAGLPADWLEGEGVQVAGLRTPYGALAYSLRSEGRRLFVDVPAGLSLPKGGLIVALPPEWKDGSARKGAAPIRDGQLLIERLPARIVIDRR